MALRKAAVVDPTVTPEAPATTQVQDVDTTQAQDVQATSGDTAQAQGVTTSEAPDTASTDAKATTSTSAQEQVSTSSSQAEVQPEAQVQVEQRKEVSAPAARGNTAVSNVNEQRKGAMEAFKQEMAEEGYEGLNVTGMSFDRIKLHEGRFKLGSDEKDLGETFDCTLMSTRPIYIVRQRDDDDSPVYYSYDANGATLTDGSSAETLQQEWIDAGYSAEEWDIKAYLEGMAVLTGREDEYDGHMVSLSIPPASKDRLSGAIAVGKQKYRMSPSGLVLRCKVGASIKKGNTTWRPWVFSIVGVAE